jgi:hypothetical protein
MTVTKKTYNEGETEAHERISLFLVVENHPVSCKVKAALLE